MRQCNNCDRDCDVIQMHRDKKRVLTLKELRSDCKRRLAPGSMRTPLLMVAFDSHPQGVVDVLSGHKFRIREISDYPFFRLAV